MPRTRLVVELGMGADLHGADYTKSARRAIFDAIHRGSLLFLADMFKDGKMPKVYIDVVIASPKPDAVDKDEVLKEVPFGEKSLEIIPGGLRYTREDAGGDSIVISNAAVTVSVET
jgi:uncharacterized protein (TIGR02058 family)